MTEFTRRSLILAAAAAATAPAALAQPAAPDIEVPAKAEILEGRNTLRHIPAGAKALVFLLHGSGGSEQFATRLHSRRVVRRMIDARYGYVSAPSLQREPPTRWDLTSADPAANPDMAYLLGLHRSLVARGEIGRDTPLFTLGMSNGGGCANLFAVVAKRAGLPLAGVADYMGPIPAAARQAGLAAGDWPPLFIVLGEVDGLVLRSNVEPVARKLAADGAEVELHIITEQPVTTDTFADIPGLGPERRAAILTGLEELKVIDAEGRRLVFRDRPLIDRAEMADLRRMTAGIGGRDVANELVIAWGGHQFRSDLIAPQLAFFERALQKRHALTGR